jgi:diguanylate cyclase (GGDEF)-like protein/PAS domain S-box-containing protein
MGSKTGSINQNLIVISEEGRVRNINTAACEFLGYKSDELIGQPIGMIFSRNEPCINSSGVSLIRDTDFYQEGGALLAKGGKKLPVWFATSSSLGIDGQADGFIIIARDAEASRQTQKTPDEWVKQLTRKNRYETIIALVTGSIHRSSELQEVLEIAVEAMCQYVDVVEHVSIFLVEGSEAVMRAHGGYPDWFVNRTERIPYPKDFAWRAIIERMPIYCADVDSDTVIGPAGREVGTKSYAGMPLYCEGNTVGSINVHSLFKNAFDQEDLKLLNNVAKQIDIAINNARQTEALRQSEERYRTLFEQSPLGVYIFDQDYQITHCNERLVQILRSSFEKIVGLDIRTLKDQCVLPFMRTALEGQKAYYEGLYDATYSQAKLWVSINLSPLRDSMGNVIGGMAVVEDITQRKRKEEKLRILHNITQALNQSLELEEIYKIAMDSVIQLDNVDLACIYLINESKNEAVMQVHRNFPDDFVQRAGVIPYPRGATWKVINSCEMFNVKNAREDPDVGPAGRDLGFRSMLGIPVTIEGKAMGVLWLLSYVEYQFAESEVELLTSVGNQIAVAIAKANLYRDLSRKKRYEEIVSTVTRSVHRSIDLQEVLENAVESMSNNIEGADNVSIYFVEGKVAIVKAYRGYPKWFMDDVGRIDYPRGFTWKTIIDSKPMYVSNTEDDKVIGAAGLRVGTKSYAAMPIRFEGNTIGTININSFKLDAFDDEELKILEIVAQQIELAISNAQHAEALRESEQRYRNLVETARDIIFTLSPDGTFTSLNAVSESITGWPRDELIGNHFAPIVHPDDLPRAMQLFTCVMKGEMPPVFELRIQNKSGEYLTVESIVTPQIKDGKVVGVLGISRDVTERKSIEEALRQSEERLNYIFDNTPNVAIQGFDIEGRVIYWNKAAEKIFGWSKDEAIGKTLDKLILDEETTHEFHSILKKVTEKKKPYGPSEWKFINCEGSEGTVISTIFPIPSSSGESEFICVDIDITERKRQEAQIHHMAMHDSLTDLPNRRALQEKLEHIISKSDHRKTHAFVVMDLDNFKLINDTLGYLQADQVLVDLAAIMRKTMRPEDLLARVGGDEFAMVIQNVSRNEAKTIAERFYGAINSYSSFLKGYSFELGISIGINLFDSRTDPQMIMAIAYSALAAAKNEGKNRVIIYHSEEYNSVELNQASQWCIRINDAVRENRLILHFQPIIRLDNCEALYMEALVRMMDSANGTILPKAFIPVAERFGLMSKIDRWVVDTVIKSIHKDDGARIFVNLSGSSLRDESLLEFIQHAVAGNKIISNCIGFEITEFTNITNIDRVSQWMIGLKEIGCQFALDDFGIGHFSFAHLLKLPVDFVKIESSFIQNMDTDPTSSAIVKAIIKVSRLMGKEVIAEGVETDAVANILRRLKIKYGQGNYWRSASAEDTYIYRKKI